jgi:hypothetical protein
MQNIMKTPQKQTRPETKKRNYTRPEIKKREQIREVTEGGGPGKITLLPK